MYQSWRGPIVGFTVSHIWSSYATCLSLEFGPLTPGDWFTDRKGNVRQFEPKGVWSITSMESWPAWWLRQNGRVVGSWELSRPRRLHALRLLIGRRLNTFEVDQHSRSTRITFSPGLQLETKTDLRRLRNMAHWLLRGPEYRNDDWSHVALRPWGERRK